MFRFAHGGFIWGGSLHLQVYTFGGRGALSVLGEDNAGDAE